MIVKLPVISFLDKLLGIVFGVCETVLILWTVYTFTMMMDMGVIGEMLLAYTEDNRILSWLYRHNSALFHWSSCCEWRKHVNGENSNHIWGKTGNY